MYKVYQITHKKNTYSSDDVAYALELHAEKYGPPSTPICNPNMKFDKELSVKYDTRISIGLIWIDYKQDTIE